MEAALKAWQDISAKYGQGDDWKAACVVQLDDGVKTNQSQNAMNVFGGLVDRSGHQVDIGTSSDNVWGIDLKVCYDYCGWDKLQTVFSFQVFTAGATNYLLPWLALTAQLPFETGEYNVIANFMSFCMALGSPMLITYSLMITILNQHWLRSQFRDLESHGTLHDTITNARMFLQESQQVPLRLSQDDGSLGSLIVLAENGKWWERLRESVQRTRRGVTLSLIAQIIVAIMSWILTVIAAFLSSLGNPSQALVLAGGCLWVWLVPIICGWITVGTQMDHSTIMRALERDDAAIAGSSVISPHIGNRQRGRHFSNATAITFRVETNEQDTTSTSGHSENGAIEEVDVAPGMTSYRKFEKQKAFRINQHRHEMRPLLQRPTRNGKIRMAEPRQVPGCFGFSVAGDERQEGPAFNYARMFTWWHVANQVHRAFAKTAENLKARRDLNMEERADYKEFKHEELLGDSLSVLQYCGLATRRGNRTEPVEINEYPEWHELDAAFWQRNIIAVLMAFLVQWCSTGAAFTIGYLTEVTGLGCRSGSYLIYGSLATIGFVLLCASSFLSHAAMLQHQTLYLLHRSEEEEEKEVSPPPMSLTWCRIGAVTTRILGRFVIIANTTWLILISFWELIGFFNNCWCDGVTLSRGAGGFIILFKDASEMAPAAVPAWAGGVFLSIFVVAASSGVFWLFCRGNRK